MPKGIDQLPLDPDSHREPDVRGTAWYQFCQTIDELLASDEYQWASTTLSGIRETVERTRLVTPGQRKAIENIEAARGRSDGFRRRYEGRRGRW